ncbi:hypothetical protein ACFLU9_00150 [Chloroflexota bacterium]
MRYKNRNIAVKDRPEEHLAKEGCRHCWIIELANGPTSEGVCKFCGAIKVFLNSIPDYSSMAKGNASPLGLPKMPDVEFDKERNRQ